MREIMNSPSVEILPPFSFSKGEVGVFVFKMTYCVEEVYCISAETGYALREYHIDLAFVAELQ